MGLVDGGIGMSDTECLDWIERHQASVRYAPRTDIDLLEAAGCPDWYRRTALERPWCVNGYIGTSLRDAIERAMKGREAVSRYAEMHPNLEVIVREREEESRLQGRIEAIRRG